MARPAHTGLRLGAWLRAAGLGLLVAAPGGAWAAGPGSCRLALALGLDVSSSVDAAEYALQRNGLAAALDSAAVREALFGATPGHVALAIYEWSGRRQQEVVLDWTDLHGPADLQRAIAAVLAAPRSENEFPTALGYAIGYGAVLIGRAPACARQVLNISGDGENNAGFAPMLAYKHFPLGRVTVNGLTIGAAPEVTRYYWREVAHGPDAFVEEALDFADFERAMTRKLFREINQLTLGALESALPAEHGG